MNAPALLQIASATPLRLFQIKGDAYEPALRSRDFLMVATADRFTYDSDYLLAFPDGEAPFLATRCPDGVHIRRRNPRYSDGWVMSLAEFNRAVSAIVVAEVKVRDDRLIQSAYADRVAA